MLIFSRFRTAGVSPALFSSLAEFKTASESLALQPNSGHLTLIFSVPM
jgi:hypothetical protein